MVYGRNCEGYQDPTAAAAMENIAADEQKVYKLRRVLEAVAEMGGYFIVGKITFRNQTDGREIRR